MNHRRAIYIVGAFVFLITAFFSKGYNHFDEHFQILEFAGWKLGLNSTDNMPWEYFFKMRPAIQPAMAVCFYRLFAVFGIPDPFLLATFTRLISATLTFFSLVMLIKTFESEVQKPLLKQTLILLSFFLWFIVFNSVRFSSENWSGSIFAIALCLSLNKTFTKPFHLLLIGSLLGISFLFRYQTGFLIMGFMLWLLFIRKEKFLHLVYISAAIIVMLGVGVLTDKWFYGEWTCTIWNYFDQNIIQNKAANFGVEPWWYYFKETLTNGIPPFSVIFIGCVILFFWFYPKHIVTFTLLPFLFIHTIIGHKELRFMFPVVYYLPVMIALTAKAIEAKWKLSNIQVKAVKVFMLCFWLTDIAVLLVVMFRPADNQISLYEKLYRQYESPATLYYTDENPYRRILDIRFYKRPDLEIVKVDSVENIKPIGERKILFATTHQKESGNKWHLVYSGLPQWMSKFDFNHWQSRTRFWYVYELQKVE